MAWCRARVRDGDDRIFCFLLCLLFFASSSSSLSSSTTTASFFFTLSESSSSPLSCSSLITSRAADLLAHSFLTLTFPSTCLRMGVLCGSWTLARYPWGWGGKGQTQPSKQLALILPNLVLIAGHLDGPGRCQPGEPVHGDLLKVLEEQHHCLGPTHPGLTISPSLSSGST